MARAGLGWDRPSESLQLHEVGRYWTKMEVRFQMHGCLLTSSPIQTTRYIRTLSIGMRIKLASEKPELTLRVDSNYLRIHGFSWPGSRILAMKLT